MSDLPRRTIEDIKTRYFVEPTLRDVYVEGYFDKLALNSWCEKNSEKSFVPYEIDSVDIPCDILTKYGLTDGNKQRVIALAKELEELHCDNYKCLVDKDFDHWLDAVEDIPQLIWTDFSSLEMYFFSEQLIKRILVDISNSKISNWESFYDSFIVVLKQLYCIKLSDRVLRIDGAWCEIKKSLSSSNSVLKFDYLGYINKNLISFGEAKKIPEFIEAFEEWLVKLDCDPRLCIRGHDFVELMSSSIKEYKGMKNFQESDALQRMLLAFIDEIDHLVHQLR
ncbi:MULTISPECIES: DUF4435 domain-containing protein [Citrobacter freundii complex]|uniref:DUF4435 domain-containing protein n=1 Tax=Citrobacter freundii complex TaxID=1344959 RepID=UPI00254E4345|nr:MULTISPECIES: DUF4435 domain-containing protein [Citrobacter freundii complex]MEB1006039.1 DUF4435 domain-containing protein [Citrobacter braakii]